MVVLKDAASVGRNQNHLRKNRSNERQYLFDAAFGADSSQEKVYDKTTRPLVEAVLDEIMDTLVSGEHVKLSSFGSFSVREKGERIGRNPKTGIEVPISPRKVLVFRASHVLKDRINKGV